MEGLLAYGSGEGSASESDDDISGSRAAADGGQRDDVSEGRAAAGSKRARGDSPPASPGGAPSGARALAMCGGDAVGTAVTPGARVDGDGLGSLDADVAVAEVAALACGSATSVASCGGKMSRRPPPPPPRLPPPDELLKGFGENGAGGPLLPEPKRVRTFPHIEGNYALHVYIPVTVPPSQKAKLAASLAMAAAAVPELRAMEAAAPTADVAPPPAPAGGSPGTSAGGGPPIAVLPEYHVSLSRTVAVRLPQVEPLLALLKHRFRGQKRFCADISLWQPFVNDERSRTFLALEVTSRGLDEMPRGRRATIRSLPAGCRYRLSAGCGICKQVRLVDDAFRLHGLPTFYEDPRPHISLAWAAGDLAEPVSRACDSLNGVGGGAAAAAGARRGATWHPQGGEPPLLWSTQMRKVECRVGQRVYSVWEVPSGLPNARAYIQE